MRQRFSMYVGVVEIESEWTARDRETQRSGESKRIFLNPYQDSNHGASRGEPRQAVIRQRPGNLTLRRLFGVPDGIRTRVTAVFISQN
jgi:hypothetical protein